MQRVKLFTTIMMLMVMCLSTSAQNNDNEPATTATGTVISAELQKILDEDEDLKQAFDKVNPEEALPFFEEDLEEISSADAFCFNKSTMILWGKNFEEKVMVWGPGLHYAFLAALKTGKVEITPINFIPEIKSTTVWTPVGKIKSSCKGKRFYCVKR